MDNKKSLQYYVNSSQLSKDVDKHYFSWQNIDEMCTKIVLDVNKDEHWRPDYIIGITRGGNIPATIISHMMNIRGEALKINLRDNGQFSESNTWMAQDAFEGKNILIVDDINVTGNTFNWLMEDWKKSVPIRDYEALQPYIDLVVNGENDILWPGKPIYFCKTSSPTTKGPIAV